MNSHDWHSRTPDELETTLQSNLDRGLTEEEAQQRLAKHGPNELPEAPPVSALTLLLGQSLAGGLAGTLQRLEGDPLAQALPEAFAHNSVGFRFIL